MYLIHIYIIKNTPLIGCNVEALKWSLSTILKQILYFSEVKTILKKQYGKKTKKSKYFPQSYGKTKLEKISEQIFFSNKGWS